MLNLLLKRDTPAQLMSYLEEVFGGGSGTLRDDTTVCLVAHGTPAMTEAEGRAFLSAYEHFSATLPDFPALGTYQARATALVETYRRFVDMCGNEGEMPAAGPPKGVSVAPGIEKEGPGHEAEA